MVIHLYIVPEWQLIDVNNFALPQAFILYEGLYSTVQYNTKVYFLQMREMLIKSRELMASANLPPNQSMV